MKSSEHQPYHTSSGNTDIRIYSGLIWNTEKEKQDWFQAQWKDGNPILQHVAQLIMQDPQE